MKINPLVKFLCSIAFLMTVTLSNAQSVDIKHTSVIDSLGKIYQHTPGFTVLIGQNQKVLYKNAYGLANYELNVHLQTNHSFAIGSLSKQFISIAILTLVEEGKISLEDKVIDHLEWFQTKERNTITIEHLLSHTSGVKDFFVNEDFVDQFIQPFSREKMLEYLSKEVEFESFPGDNYKYSNAGYVYLTLVIEQVTNKNIQEYMQENIFDPLNLDETFWGNPKSLHKGTVTGYITSRDGKKTLSRESYLYQNLYWVLGAGAIFSSVEDMFRWIASLTSYKLIKEETLNLALTPYKLNNGSYTNYGFGFEIKTENNQKVITHSGMINGFQSNMILFPDNKLFGIAISNRMDFAPNFIYDVVKAIAN